MAFEYLMAHYLLTRQADKVAANLGRLDDFNYPHMPQHYQEALWAYLRATADSPQPGLDLTVAKGRLQQQTYQRFKDFNRIVAEHLDDPETARQALTPEYGDTYWFFDLFGHSAAAFVTDARSTTE